MNASNRKLNDEELSVLLSQHAAHGINWMNGSGRTGENLCPAAAIEAMSDEASWHESYDGVVSTRYYQAFRRSGLKSASESCSSFSPKTTRGLLYVLRLAGLV